MTVAGVFETSHLEETVAAIAAVQLPDGNIPWIPGEHTDPWNLVEAAMALDVGGLHAEASARLRVGPAHAEPRRLLARLLRGQRGQGPHARHERHVLHRERRLAPLPHHRRHRVPSRLLAGGRTHHRLRARPPDRDRRDRLARRRSRRRRAAHRLVEHSPLVPLCDRDRRPDSATTAPTGSCRWARSRSRSRIDPSGSSNKDRWAMDWYYPILGGVLRGQPAQMRVASKWDTFVVRGPRRALRLRSTLGHRRRDLRAGHGARCHRRTRSGPRTVRLGPVPPPRRRRLLVRHELRRRIASTDRASISPSTSPPGTRARSCSPPTHWVATARLPACSAARTCPSGSRPKSSSKPASRSKPNTNTTAADCLLPVPRALHGRCVGRTRVQRRSMRSEPVVETGSKPSATGALPDVERRLAALVRILEHVVEHEHAGRHDVAGPGLVVGHRDVVGVATVDEEEPEWRASSTGRRSGNHPSTATTTSSRPASSIVRRKNGSVSMRPVRGSTTSGRDAPTPPGSPPSRDGGRW